MQCTESLSVIRKRRETPVAVFSRRDFLGGLLVGGGVVATGMYLRPAHMFEIGEVVVEKVPEFNAYPVTRYDDCYRLFMNIGQTLLPRVRRLPVYQKHERDAFMAAWELNFYLYANDYAARFQKHYGDPTLITPRDRNVGERYLVESIHAYPKAWSRIIHTMLTHAPEVLLAYLFEEKS